MTILGFGLAHIFFQLCAMVFAGFLIVLTWEENLPVRMKYLATCAILVGWYGVAVFINGFANIIVAERDNSCRSITHTVEVDGKKVELDRYFVLCQDKSGRMVIKGPKGELKG